MNVLELLLQRIRLPGGNSDPDWQAHLADLNNPLPPRDQVLLSPGQTYGSQAQPLNQLMQQGRRLPFSLY